MKKRPMRRKWERKEKTPIKDKEPQNNYRRRAPQDNWLKYFRVIRYYMRRKYDLSLSDLEMLLFLYSEGLFTRSDFSEFGQIMSWDRRRFDKDLEQIQFEHPLKISNFLLLYKHIIRFRKWLLLLRMQ